MNMPFYSVNDSHLNGTLIPAYFPESTSSERVLSQDMPVDGERQ